MFTPLELAIRSGISYSPTIQENLHVVKLTEQVISREFTVKL
jgi:hypothetical protein